MVRDDDEGDELDVDEDELVDDEAVESGPRRGGSALGFLVGFVLGGLFGAGAALLAAPERGAVTRSRLRRQVRRMRDDTVDRVGEMRDDAERGLRRVRRRVRRKLPD